jgi:hypothetical protein
MADASTILKASKLVRDGSAIKLVGLKAAD